MALSSRVLAAAALALATSPKARACSVCSSGDPLLASSDPAAIAGLLRLQVDAEYLRAAAGREELTQGSYRLNAVVRPVEIFSATATLPVLVKTVRESGELVSRLSGPGDLELGARLALLRAVDLRRGRVHELAVSAGASFPTGSRGATARSADGKSEVLVDPHGQLGTGGFGPYLGLHYRYERGDWLGFAAMSYRVRTEAGYLDGSRYKFGDAALFSAHGQYRPVRSVAIDLGVDGRYARPDRAAESSDAASADVGSTGGTVLSVAPALYFNVVGRLWVFARAQIPFFEGLFGEQDVGPSFAAGFQVQVL